MTLPIKLNLSLSARLVSVRRLGLFVAIFGLMFCAGARSAQAGRCPNLVILLDKSGSMIESPAGGTAPAGGSKWELAKAALKALLASYDGRLPIGISLFASDNSCGPAKLDIAPDYHTADPIIRLIDASMPNSATPTSESVTAIAGSAVLQDPSRAQYMLLLTDGIPNCALNEPTDTVNALTAARMRSAPITTFVLGFGALPTSVAAAMDSMAVAGGAPSMGTPKKYYTADDMASLTASLEQIFAVILGSGACGDSCYDVGCPKAGDACIRGKCQPKSHAALTCDPKPSFASYISHSPAAH